MSTKAIYEATGKKLLNKCLSATAVESRCVSIDVNTNWDELTNNNHWLQTEVFQVLYIILFTMKISCF